MAVVQKQNSMAFKMKSSMAKLTNSPAKQDYDNRNKGRFTYSDSLDIYKKQTKLNTLADKINKHVLDKADFYVDPKDGSKQIAYSNDTVINNQPVSKSLNEYYKLKNEYGLLKFKYFLEYQDKESRRNVAGHAENPFMLEPGNPDFYELDQSVVEGRQTPWGANKYDPIMPQKPSGDLRPKQEKIDVMKSKNLEFMPTEKREIKLKKALPQELSESDYFTIDSVSTRGKYGNLILKDQAGKEVFRGSREEYQEKYGDVLQRGTKKYGKENLQRRLYIKK